MSSTDIAVDDVVVAVAVVAYRGRCVYYIRFVVWWWYVLEIICCVIYCDSVMITLYVLLIRVLSFRVSKVTDSPCAKTDGRRRRSYSIAKKYNV